MAMPEKNDKNDVRCGLTGGADPAVPVCNDIRKEAAEEDIGDDDPAGMWCTCGFYICGEHTGDTFMQPYHDVMTHAGDDEDWG